MQHFAVSFVRRFPKSAAERVMALNAIELYGLPTEIEDEPVGDE